MKKLGIVFPILFLLLTVGHTIYIINHKGKNFRSSLKITKEGLELAFLEGQVKAMKGNYYIKEVRKGCYSFTKSPWETDTLTQKEKESTQEFFDGNYIPKYYGNNCLEIK